MTEAEWRAYLRREIERMLDIADGRSMELTLEFLRAA